MRDAMPEVTIAGALCVSQSSSSSSIASEKRRGLWVSRSICSIGQYLVFVENGYTRRLLTWVQRAWWFALVLHLLLSLGHPLLPTHQDPCVAKVAKRLRCRVRQIIPSRIRKCTTFCNHRLGERPVRRIDHPLLKDVLDRI